MYILPYMACQTYGIKKSQRNQHSEILIKSITHHPIEKQHVYVMNSTKKSVKLFQLRLITYHFTFEILTQITDIPESLKRRPFPPKF